MAIYTPHEPWEPSEQCEVTGVTDYGWVRVVIVIQQANGVRRTNRVRQYAPSLLRADGGLKEIKAAIATVQSQAKRPTNADIDPDAKLLADIRKTGRMPHRPELEDV